MNEKSLKKLDDRDFPVTQTNPSYKITEPYWNGHNTSFEQSMMPGTYMGEDMNSAEPVRIEKIRR